MPVPDSVVEAVAIANADAVADAAVRIGDSGVFAAPVRTAITRASRVAVVVSDDDVDDDGDDADCEGANAGADAAASTDDDADDAADGGTDALPELSRFCARDGAWGADGRWAGGVLGGGLVGATGSAGDCDAEGAGTSVSGGLRLA